MFHWRACLLIVISGGAWSHAPIPSQTATQVTTRRTAIQVTFGEPNVWSLDQAHYLLEQRFQKNQTLEATRPGADELNASAINGNCQP